MDIGTESDLVTQLIRASDQSNERLDALLAEQKRTNHLLEWLGSVLGHQPPGWG
jgi:hypothetical protein